MSEGWNSEYTREQGLHYLETDFHTDFRAIEVLVKIRRIFLGYSVIGVALEQTCRGHRREALKLQMINTKFKPNRE